MLRLHCVIGFYVSSIGLAAGMAHAATIHVPADHPTIQAGIIAASDGDTVLVAEGHYLENVNFRGRNIVLASEYLIDADPSHIMNTIIDGSNPVDPDTASCVLIVSGESSDAVLDGFTLTGGTGTVWTDIHYNLDYREGGGILVELSSPIIRNNLIIDNEAVNTSGVESAGGGGIRCGDADPLIVGNVIAYNRGRYGGGIVMNFATGTIRNNIIAHNTGGQDYGGSGIWTYEVGPTTIENNTIVGNASVLEGGGIRVSATSITAQNNILWGNTSASSGSQIAVLGSATATVSYSDVEGGWEGEGNIEDHPLFNTANLYLTEDSPCIDAGNPASSSDPEDPGSPGAARFPAMGGLRNDMGAYGGTAWDVWDSFTRPELEIDPWEIAFHYAEPGASDTAQLVIRSRGSGALTISDIEARENSSYSITTDLSSPLVVNPYAEHTVAVFWAPNEDVVLADSLMVLHDDPSLSSPAVIRLSVQPFARMNDGIIVNDGGDSRSVNWIDYDDDDYLDLFISNGLSGGENNFLYRSNGDDSFTKVSGDPIVNDGGSSDGSSWGDFDNDGDIDAFVVNWYDQNNLLYRNNGDGTFSPVLDGDLVSEGGYSETCSWGDYDNDGYLDLVVANSGMDAPGVNFLYHNDGDGTFSKVEDGEIVTDETYSRCTSWADYDNDGDLDLFVANEANENNALHENNGDGTFTKITSGPPVSNRGESMGASWGDYDNDGDLDLFVTNLNQNNFFYRNNGDRSFTRIYNGSIVNDRGWSFGSSWGDYDNDGDLDLFVANGWDEPQTNFLYQNDGNGSFTRITEGDIVTDEGWAFGAAWGDYDRDGDLDLMVAKWYDHTENNSLYFNTGNLNHWINISCDGTYSNRSAIGAKIRVLATIGGSPVWQLREISGQTGYCGQNDLSTHFGLGDATTVDSIVIEWPSRIVQIETNVAADQFFTVTEEGTPADEAVPIGPSAFMLTSISPNPSRGRSDIRFTLPAAMRVTLSIYDMRGQYIVSLLSGEAVRAGDHTVRWNATDRQGAPVSSGVYVARLSSAKQALTQKLVLMR